MIFAAALLLTAGAIIFTLVVRSSDVPQPEMSTGWEHLEQRKARIYENLRDLQFEYRVGKLSEADYSSTKLKLQGELAGVLAELDQVTEAEPPRLAEKPEPGETPVSAASACPHCGAKFPVRMKFCGSCGKAMA